MTNPGRSYNKLQSMAEKDGASRELKEIAEVVKGLYQTVYRLMEEKDALEDRIEKLEAKMR